MTGSAFLRLERGAGLFAIAVRLSRVTHGSVTVYPARGKDTINQVGEQQKGAAARAAISEDPSAFVRPPAQHSDAKR